MIYVVIAAESGRMKVGTADHPRKRLKQLQTGCPEPLLLFAVMPGGRRSEADLHRRLSPYRIRGEWFTFSDESRSVVERVVRVRMTKAAAEVAMMLSVNRFALLELPRQKAPAPAPGTQTAAIWGIVSACPDRHFTAQEVAAETGYAVDSVRRLLSRMVERGIVIRRGWGAFQVNAEDLGLPANHGDGECI